MVQINPAIQSYLDFLIDQRQKHWDAVETLREYTNGEQSAQMTDDQKVLLVGADAAGRPNSDPEFNVNVCSIIIDALVDRLNITGFSVTIPDNEARSEDISREVMRWWDASNMDGGQQDAHFAAARDADAYPIVMYDTEAMRPTVVLNESFDGDAGVEVAYEDAHPQTPLYAVKRWEMQRPTVGNANTPRVLRMNVYFDNRVEYYISQGVTGSKSQAGWRPLQYGDRDFVADQMTLEQLNDPYNRPYEACVVWQTDNGRESGTPLGLQVKHLRHNARGNPYGRSRIADIVPGLQDAINRAGLSIQAAALLSGFKEAVITGFFPKKDPEGVSNAMKRSPAAVHYFGDKEVSITQFAESDLMQLISVLDKFIVLAATLTSTPLSLFNLTAQTPAEGTQKQLEQALVTAVEKAQRDFGQTWQNIIRQMLVFEAAFNPNGKLSVADIVAIPEWDINVEWANPQTRNELEDRQIAVIDYTQLDVPIEMVWKRFYSAEEIAKMQELESVRTGQAIGNLAQQVIDLEAQNAQQPQDEQETDNANNSADQQPVAAGAG